MAEESTNTGPSAGGDKDVSGDSMTTKIGEVGGDAEIIQEKTVNINLGDLESALQGIKKKKFTISDSLEVKTERLREADKLLVYPEKDIQRFTALNKTNRILLLTGPPESGKYLIALYLANRLNKEKKNGYDVRYVRPLRKDVNFNLFELISTGTSLKGKIIIFSDALSKKNKGLKEFLYTYNREQADFAAKKLKEADAYILLTADTGTFDELKLTNIPIKVEVSHVSGELLVKGFDLKLAHYCKVNNKDVKEARQVLSDDKDSIIQKLGSMAKIVSFIENYLEKIMSGDKKCSAAIEEVNDIRKAVEYWFVEELGKDKSEFEAWGFAFCLALFSGISYFVFEKVYREVIGLLVRRGSPFKTNDLFVLERLLQKVSDAAPDEDSWESFTFSMSENILLRKCKAQIVEDNLKHSDIIEFSEPRYRRCLFTLLMEKYRNALLAVVPQLVKWVDEPINQEHREYSAFALGKIGEINADAIVLDLANDWARNEEYYRRTHVGYLYVGIFTSKKKDYLDYAKINLKNMSINDNILVQWAAISAYKQIGAHHLEFAMRELRRCLENIVKDFFKAKDHLDFLFLYDDDVSEDELIKRFNHVREITGHLLDTILVSIVELCILLNPIDVLFELKKWFVKGNKKTRIITVNFFLGEKGILYRLERRLVEYYLESEDEEEDGFADSVDANVIIDTLASIVEANENVAGFIHDMYEKCFPEFPPDAQRVLKNILMDYLERWTIDILPHKELKNTMKKLLITLYNSGGTEFQHTLWDSINRWKLPEKEDDEIEEEREKKEKRLKDLIDEVSREIYDF